MSRKEKELTFNMVFMALPVLWGLVGIALLMFSQLSTSYGLFFLPVAAIQFFFMLTLTTANQTKKLKDWQRMLLTVFMALVAVPNLMWLTWLPLSLLANATHGLAFVIYPMVLLVFSLFFVWRITMGVMWARNLRLLFGVFFLTGVANFLYSAVLTGVGQAPMTSMHLVGLILGAGAMIYGLVPSLYLLGQPYHRLS